MNFYCLMKSGRGRRKQGCATGFNENLETWILKPLNEEDQSLTPESNDDAVDKGHSLTPDSNDPPSVSESCQPQILDPTPTTPGAEVLSRGSARRTRYNHRNPRWASRNRRARVAKQQLAKELEPCALNSEVGSSGVDDERVNKEREVEEEKREAQGKAKDGNLASKIEVVGGERIEALESSKDEDDIISRLEHLRLSAEETQLSEEQLRINDQAQEDEVVLLT